MKNFSLGAMPSKIDLRDYKLAAGVTTERIFPIRYSLEMGKIKNQGAINSCVAHSAAEIAEYFNKQQEIITSEMSVGFIYGTRYNYTGEGMYLRDALKTLKEIGICDNEQFPYNKEVPEIISLLKEKKEDIVGEEENRISTYFSVKTIDEIKATLIDYGPVMISIKWYEDLKVENGIITTEKKNYIGNHCILICGWETSGWKIMNSWGKNWGENGYAILPYDYKIEEAYGITDEILREKVDIIVPKRNFLFDIFYKIINSFLNFFKKISEKLKI